MINRTKLQNVVEKDGKIEAQCPACHAAGADSKRNHLVVYPDGKFGCVANPDDKEHNKIILKLVGERGMNPPPQLQIRRQFIRESQVLMKIGRPGQKNPTSSGTGEKKAADTGMEKSGPGGPAVGDTQASGEFSTQEARRFLDEP